MSRNGSGTYTLPTGNPVVSGTLIESTWANNTLSDIASALTDSLSRSGQGGMTAAFRAFDGTSTVPGIAWSSETTTGWYRAGSGDMRLVVTGSQVVQYLASGISITGTFDVSGNSTFSGQSVTLENSTAYYPQLINRNKTADANGSYFVLEKIRNTSVVQNGDVLGNLIFRGYDGSAYLQGAAISAVVSAVPGANDMPSDLVLSTTADGASAVTERMRITNVGDVYIRGGKGLAWYDSTNTGYWAQYNSSGNLLFSNGTERMRLDASGNLGLGVTPSGWNGYTAFEIKGGTALASSGVETELATNAYFNSGWKYKSATSLKASRYESYNGYHAWFTDNAGGTTGNAITFTQAMTLDASGNLGIGVTPSAWYTTGGTSRWVELAGGTSFGAFGGSLTAGNNWYANSAGTDIYKATGYASQYVQSSGQHIWKVSGVGSAGAAISFTQAMTLDTSGNLLVGTTSANGRLSIDSAGTTSATYIIFGRNSAASNKFTVRSDGAGFLDAAAWTYGSDATIKENIEYLKPSNCLSLILNAKPAKFDYIDGQKSNYGYIAQDVQTWLPEAVSETPNGKLGLQDGFINAVGTGAIQALNDLIQEQQAMIVSLKAELDSVKAELAALKS